LAAAAQGGRSSAKESIAPDRTPRVEFGFNWRLGKAKSLLSNGAICKFGVRGEADAPSIPANHNRASFGSTGGAACGFNRGGGCGAPRASLTACAACVSCAPDCHAARAKNRAAKTVAHGISPAPEAESSLRSTAAIFYQRG